MQVLLKVTPAQALELAKGLCMRSDSWNAATISFVDHDGQQKGRDAFIGHSDWRYDRYATISASTDGGVASVQWTDHDGSNASDEYLVTGVSWTTSTGNYCHVSFADMTVQMQGRRDGVLRHFVFAGMEACKVLEYQTTEPSWTWFETKHDVLSRRAAEFGGKARIAAMPYVRAAAEGVPRDLYAACAA